jgi:hypothetical protein
MLPHLLRPTEIDAAADTRSRRIANTGGISMSFGLYLIGYLLVIAGLTYGATLMHIPARWITAIDIVLAGIGIVTAVKATRQKDASN